MAEVRVECRVLILNEMNLAVIKHIKLLMLKKLM